MDKRTLKEFKKIIRAIVREEVKSQLPGIVAEMYFQNKPQIVEQRPERQQSRSLADSLNFEEQDIPYPLDNSDEGIYQQSPIGTKNEVTSKLMDKNNPYNFIYEDITPLDERPQPKSAPLAGDVSRYGKMFEAMERKARDSAPMQQSPEAKMRELEAKRKALEVKVG